MDLDLKLSLARKKSRKIYLLFFSLSVLLPYLLIIYLVDHHLLPQLTPLQGKTVLSFFYLGLALVIILPLLGFLLVFKWYKSFENMTWGIIDNLLSISKGKGDFGRSAVSPEAGGKMTDPVPAGEENDEIISLVRSFDKMLISTAGQLKEGNRLQDLLAKFLDVSSSLTAELDFDRLFPMIIRKISEVMEAERTSLYVLDWEGREIWTKVAEGIDEIRIPLGSGISGRVAETGEMINVADAWELPYFDRSFDEKNRFRTRSVLCLPIKNHEREIIGVLQVINKKSGDCFSRQDEVFLRALASQVGIALDNSLLLNEIITSFTSSISTLSAMVDARHHYTAGHSERVMEYSLAMAGEFGMNKNELEALKYAAILHDIGKMGIRDEVLTKNGPYNLEDREEMKSHPLKTRRILDQFHFPRHLKRVPEIASLHHEKLNGSGYPYGLSADQIPLAARIIAVADMFDAITSKRDYPKYTEDKTLSHDPMPIPVVVDLLKKLSGIEYDPDVVGALMARLTEILLKYRGCHFSPQYVDYALRLDS